MLFMRWLRYIPNLLTVLRIAAIVPICWALWQEHFTSALLLLVLAGLSDGLDGWLARRYGWFTALGAFLDPVADKLFIVSIMVLFGLKGYLPWWLVWLIFGRDMLIMGGAMVYRWVTGSLEMKPLLISKLNTALQISLLAAILLDAGFYALPDVFMQGLEGLVAATTFISGAAYVWLWTQAAFGQRGAV